MTTKEQTKLVFLSNDLVFKFIFGTDNHIKYVADLLESFYNLESGSLKNLKVLNSVKFNSETIKEKNFEMDVLVELENGDLINLEMYNNYDVNAEKKSLLYISKVLGNKSLKIGEKYDLARKAHQINFVKDDRVHNNKLSPIRKYTIINEENMNDRISPDLFKIYIIDIDDKDKFRYTNISERLKLWLEILSAESEEELDKLAKKDSLIGEVVKDMKDFSSEEWVQDYTSRDRLIESQHETEIKEIAKSMLEEELDISLISKITKLSLEEIEKIDKSIKSE
ncbi:MAG: PD-(D/E)XK nuclease family transposase [Ruminococcus sp.]|nr:PD-(D/E)XK nuclease family transposase [Ruminococcus sp.]